LNQEVAELLEKVTGQHSGNPISPTELVEILQSNMLLSKILSSTLGKERQWYLKDNQEDVGNGFYRRHLQSNQGVLDLEVPRSRTGKFQSQLLPVKYVRYDNSLEDFLKQLMLSGLSKSKIKQALKARSMTMPQELVDQLSDEMEQEFRQILTKPIPCELIALIVDCKQVQSILENGAIGMKYVYTAIDTIFKNSLHQLCIVHMNRNICKHLMDQMINNADRYVAFVKLPKPARMHLYSTNVVQHG